jgi:hypothetical protein
LIWTLLQEGVQLGQYFYGPVKRWIGAFLISADANQVFRTIIGSQQEAQRLGLLHVLLGGNTRHQTAQTLKHGDGRVVIPHGEISVENHVAVEQRANGVGDRILLIVAFHQDRIKRGDAATLEAPRPLHQSSQHIKH